MKKNLPNEWRSDLPEDEQDDLLQKALRQKMDADLRKKWGAALAEEQAKRSAFGFRRRLLGWAVAASVLLLVSIGTWWFMGPAQNSASQLAKQYLLEIANQATDTKMGSGNNDADWQAAQELYAQRLFAETIQKLGSATPDGVPEARRNYLLALCFVQTDPPDYKQALIQLEAARLANGSSDLQESIQWIKALVLVKMGDKNAARAELQQIESRKGWFSDKAQRLLKTMD